MHRTQVYLKESERRMLHLISQRERISLSELIRRAIEKTYSKKAQDKDLVKAIEGIAGIWKGRTDLGSTEAYVRSLRKERRLRGFNGQCASRLGRHHRDNAGQP